MALDPAIRINLDRSVVLLVEHNTQALDALNASPPKLGSKLHTGHIALRAALGYLALRFAGQWEKGRARLTRWMARFDEKFPELKALVPH